jgi:tetratricopeptide (TPR) repeat protein
VEPIASIEPKTFENMLDYANSSISEGNLEDAIKAFNNLIKKGNNLEETIQGLRSAVYRYPSEVIVWQALGDGYAKSNRLQEALDAYTKAEELIK